MKIASGNDPKPFYPDDIAASYINDVIALAVEVTDCKEPWAVIQPKNLPDVVKRSRGGDEARRLAGAVLRATMRTPPCGDKLPFRVEIHPGGEPLHKDWNPMPLRCLAHIFNCTHRSSMNKYSKRRIEFVRWSIAKKWGRRFIAYWSPVKSDRDEP